MECPKLKLPTTKKHNMTRIFSILVFTVTFFITNLLSCSAQSQSVDANEIRDAIDLVIFSTNTKIDYREEQRYINKVVSYGDAAVPFLMQKLEETKDEKSWGIIRCLCEISSEASLKFVREILQKHARRDATTAAIRLYPIPREDEITTLLIELEKVQKQRWDASERLRYMIYRKPSRAGILVAALKDVQELYEFDGRLWDILAEVSGYSHTWGIPIPNGEKPQVFFNNFWREWWKRNENKDIFGWLVEACSADNPSRKETSIGQMAYLCDKRAIPYLLAAIDDESIRVRYYGVIGLKKLNNTYPESGYLWETFLKEEKEVIRELKAEFSSAK